MAGYGWYGGGGYWVWSGRAHGLVVWSAGLVCVLYPPGGGGVYGKPTAHAQVTRKMVPIMGRASS